MKALAIIPARGGSRVLPEKNTALLCGKPLIVHTIEHAQRAELVTDVVVSTNDPRIASIANDADADVIMRPDELATDYAPSEWAIEHVLETYTPSLVVMLQCTSPIRTPEDIDAAIAMVEHGGYDSVLSCVKLHQFVWRDSDHGAWAVNYNPLAMRPMRQAVDDYVETGSIYVFRPEILSLTKTRLGGKIGIYEMPYWTRCEVDTAEDLALCEWILENV